MSFAWPQALWGLMLLPAAAVLYLHSLKKGARYPVSFTNLSVLEGAMAPTSLWRRRVAPALFMLGALALLVGLARPQATVLVPRDQATVVLVMDTSGSMNATDVDPSRLHAAQASASSFVDRLPGRLMVSVVAFSDEVNVLAQPTIDRAAAATALDSLDADGGTAIGDAISDALELVRPRERDESDGKRPGGSPSLNPATRERPAAVLLLSDGEQTAGAVDPLEAAQRAHSLKVPVFTIALGTPEGIVRDPYGRMIRVPPDTRTLRTISDMTEAEFFAAPSEEDLDRIYQELGSRIGFRSEHTEITFAFAGGGALLLLIAAAVSLYSSGRLP